MIDLPAFNRIERAWERAHNEERDEDCNPYDSDFLPLDTEVEQGGVMDHYRIDRPPQLPAEISNDGREIWDWAVKLSEHIHRRAKMSVLRTQISRIGTQCGYCAKWMCNTCPRETHVHGRRRGPSMNAYKCNQFIESQRSAEWRDELQKRLTALNRGLPA